MLKRKLFLSLVLTGFLAITKPSIADEPNMPPNWIDFPTEYIC
jgi:hypothetical protein